MDSATGIVSFVFVFVLFLVLTFNLVRQDNCGAADLDASIQQVLDGDEEVV